MLKPLDLMDNSIMVEHVSIVKSPVQLVKMQLSDLPETSVCLMLQQDYVNDVQTDSILILQDRHAKIETVVELISVHTNLIAFNETMIRF